MKTKLEPPCTPAVAKEQPLDVKAYNARQIAKRQLRESLNLALWNVADAARHLVNGGLLSGAKARQRTIDALTDLDAISIAIRQAGLTKESGVQS